ncbi:transcription-repair coupling factor [Psychromonas sp. Urea-02u-13]|uniref:transcription-repair coupling factor n=1 Tax=Psychromonas sp. Urea-02u-13 TaxID=2058326 RepID=UPI000C3394BD|nr:transcription-repair coupling factor [Psychromonas sp. Urea-02u-13]PKG38904.1 transcription-repair coupling factor [Psychromonas sp. Urea-02u-13]
MKNNLLLNIPALKNKNDRLVLANLQGSSLALTISECAKQQKAPLILITSDTPSALKLRQELSYFVDDEIELISFPDWETLPYDHFSPHQDIISTRIETLFKLPSIKQGILIVPISTLLLRLAPKSYLKQHTLIIKSGQVIELQTLRADLEEAGYYAVDQVMDHGEFCARGSILDIFPMGSDSPYRLDFFDDEIDSIRPFNSESQRSLSAIDEIKLLPAHEFATDSEAIKRFKTKFSEKFTSSLSTSKDSIFSEITQYNLPAGIEYYLPLFFEQTTTLFDYLPSNAKLAIVGDINQATLDFWQTLETRYNDRSIDLLRPLLTPNELYLRHEQCFEKINQWPRYYLQPTPLSSDKAGRLNFDISLIDNIQVEHKKKQPLAGIEEFIRDFTGKVLFSVQSAGRKESLVELLAPLKLTLPEFKNIDDFNKSKSKLGITISQVENSFIISESNFAFITENELLGFKVTQSRRRSESTDENYSSDNLVANLAELKVGQPVVHIDYGVGRYLGLQTIETAGNLTEFFTLEYLRGDKLYVPVSALHLISRYSGHDVDNAPLSKLGTETWQKAKKRAAEKVRDVAAELLEVYAQRAAKIGHSYKLNKNNYALFKNDFPFEETHDQALSINAVISNMCSTQPMDRLVCGDVGFGKTEVAMRAAFLATDNTRQVALLVPTTLLAQQHVENFKDRFANWPVRIEVLSRFKTAKEQKQILADTEAGKVDILIGTHKLLSTSLKFADLGLLIIDEEHRFGVRQKEKIKALRAQIDILTLTATPIPRTLNMSMNGMRDLSIIATPPAKRLAVKTFVQQKTDQIVSDAITREIMRGGQVYFLHNNVQTIEKAAEDIQTLLPQAKVSVAHGQMNEHQLEKVMSDFYHQRQNVLVCTTIIETGIDIPSANTILINRADHLGLAQLHQLRGRVGRSHHQAYAYLLTPPKKLMTKDAQKRLQAIESLDTLGAGFTLATHDLEIRGAGELLGDDQSGQISSIGYNLYMEMLNQAVTALQSGREPSLEHLLSSQAEVELRIPALIPSDYIHDVNLRLSLYKRIANSKDKHALKELQVEMIDRFGLLPAAAKNLIQVTEVKQRCTPLGIKRLEAHANGGNVQFTDNTPVDPMFLVSLLQKQGNTFKLDGPTKLKFSADLEDSRTRINWITQLLNSFKDHLIKG